MSSNWNNPHTEKIHLADGQVVEAEVNGKSVGGKSGFIFLNGKEVP